ncbi:MAG: hypothetical protein QOG25_3846 [Acetobacteraceae bacterium]|nr:hypothetical protein [Acetobacteraceae bacterium]
MENLEELEFVIPAYTPETMLLDRLLQYLQQIGEVVGAAEDMHLVRIEPSSTKPVFKMPTPIAIRARERIAAVRGGGGGTQIQRAAYNRIRQMVKKDGGKPASLQDRTGVILDFPPNLEEVGAILEVRQASNFDGTLLRVGGVGEPIPVLMQDLAGDIFSGFSAPKSLAKTMAKLLFEPIRVSGIGSWDRSPAGEWKLNKMLIQTYEPLGDETLVEVFQKLRSVSVVWPANADEILRAERESAL